MYEFQMRVRFSEVDANGQLKLISVLNYFQDASTFQSEDQGVGTSYLKDRKMAWVLNYWQIDIMKYPKLCDEIIVGTLPYELKGFLGYRNFCMKDAKTSEMLAVANSIWTLMDLDKMRPCRVTEEIMDAYPMQEKLEMEYTDRKVRFLGDGELQEQVKVGIHNIDTNNHMNNGQYVQLASAYLEKDFRINRLRVEYQKSALLSDEMLPYVYRQKDNVGVSFVNTEGKIYANVEFSRQPQK